MGINSELVEAGKIKDSFSFEFKKGDRKGEKYEVFMDLHCKNPVCPCRDLSFKIQNMDDAGEETTAFNFILDLEKRKASSLMRKASTVDKNFARSFVKELTSEHWITFLTCHYFKKNFLHNQTNIEDLDLNFNHTDIEEGLMIAWHELFFYEDELIKTVNEKKFFLDDQYCLRTKCSCRSVVITFLEIDNDKPDRVAGQYACLFDYDKKTIKNYDKAVPDEVIELIRKDGTELASIYKKRHKTLRVLYEKYKKRAGIRPVSEPDVVTQKKETGRNDPCPCGSGKKYKKCCMV